MFDFNQEEAVAVYVRELVYVALVRAAGRWGDGEGGAVGMKGGASHTAYAR